MSARDWSACSRTATAGRSGGGFDQATAIAERLRHGPPAPLGEDAAPLGPPPSRWTLPRIGATIPALRDYSRSGVWRVLTGLGLRRRLGRVQQFSPDPDYAAKVARVAGCLTEAASAPGRVETLFLDEMGYTRWPEPGPDWGLGAPAPPPLADRCGAPPRQWRLVGTLNAVTGRVDHRDGYIVGRKQLGHFYRRLDAVYPQAERIYVIQDNWSVHHHAEVLAVLATLPRLEPVWLPTYAPWLNPIEKLWGRLRQEVLRQHRLAGDWEALRGRVTAFLDQFQPESEDLLHTVGLRGDGRLAHALRPG